MAISDIPLIKPAPFAVASAAETSFIPPRWYFEQPLWVEDPGAPGNAAHNYALPVRIRGVLKHAALERSLAELLRRQQVLRSAFTMVDGRLVQNIMPMPPVSVPTIDLTSLPSQQKVTRATEILVQDSQRPFDLRFAPLLRAALLRLESDHYILSLTTHHIVCDDWSTGVLLRELFMLYAAFSANQPSPLPEISYQYADFAASLEQRFQGQELQTRLNFWRSRLDGRNDFHHIMPDRPRFTHRSYRGTHQMLALDDALSKAVKQLSARERVSPYMVLLAALQCLLRAYSGDDHVGVGSCVANRPSPKFENLVGPFANVTLLRTDFTSRQTFREVLREVRQDCLTAYSYQDFPFGAAVQALRPVPEPGRNPLFQVLFVLLNAPNESCQVPGMTIEPIALDTGTTRYELNLWVKYQDRVELDLQYNSELFEPATARSFLERYRDVLARMVATPDAQIDAMQIRTASVMQDQAPHAPATHELPSSHNEIEQQLMRLFQESLRTEQVSREDDFFELGGDSLIAAQLFSRIETTFHQKIPLSALVHASTVARLAQVIAESSTRAPANYLVPIQPGVALPPLFCVHGQSGNVLMYRILAPYLGTDQPVYALQPRGIDGKQTPLTRIEDMATEYLREIRRIQPKGPFFLAGYCMGGTVAWEMAQQLRSSGDTVALLALLDTYDWSQLRTNPSPFHELHLKAQLMWFSATHFRHMNWRERVSAVKQRLLGVSTTASAEALSETNRRAATDYIPRRYDGRVLHVCMARKYPRYKDSRLELEGLSGQIERFSVRAYPWQLFLEPVIQQWSAKLRSEIDSAIAGI